VLDFIETGWAKKGEIVIWCRTREARTSFSPPRPTRLKDLAEAGQFSVPRVCEMHVGEDDWQSIPANVQALGRLTGISVIVVPGGDHDLGKDYVGPLLDQWLVG
jgi:hypothetical protein